MVMGLLYMLTLWSNVVVLYGRWIQWLFVASAALTDSHYKTDIISSVGHPRTNSVVPLVLCTIVCNIRDTGVVLQVSRDSANPVISRIDHTIEL
jgi:uncharacterized membrane protein